MRVGILTSGGDCQALNATMRALVKALYRQDKKVEIIGFLEGYKGLMYGKYQMMKEEMSKVEGTELLIPPMWCCTDNAAMIGASGQIAYNHKCFDPRNS